MGERCAAVSVAREEDLAGTASRVARWVLIEQPGPWGRDAVIESRLDELIGRTIRSAGRRHRFRPVLIRRPHWWEGQGPRRLYLAHTHRAGGWIETVELEDERQLLHVDWAALDSRTAPGLGAPGPAAVHLVCTNGRHDPCCADLGRPVVRALAESRTPEVWESSHVGGDRFAANVVCLPSGVYYGRVGAADAAGILADLARGVLRLEHLRGRSCFAPMVQAAEIFARRHVGETRLGALHVGAAHQRDADRTIVEVRHGDARFEVTVTRERDEGRVLSCGASASTPWRYRLERIDAR